MKAKKNKQDRSEQMQQVSAGLRDVLGMTHWRKEHPKATWAEIEAAVDERINQLRAQLIQDVVQMGGSEDWSQKPEAERSRYTTFGKPLWARGEQTRWLQTTGGEAVKLTRTKRGEVCTQHHSYFSRLSDAERFEEAALVETHRRGLEQATAVCAVQDGAEWLQGLVDNHRADAVRILDCAHAAEYVNEIGQAVRAAGGRLPATWLKGVLHRLKHQGPTRVLTHLAWLTARYPNAPIQEKLSYVQKRAAHMKYPTYQAAGWPIGSGSVESANKLVVEARLKGAGMRWGRQNVNPMLVLRNAVCNRRWNETWAAAVAQ